MRVLLLTPNAPSRTHINGGSTRMHRLYRRLIELGGEVTVVTPIAAQDTHVVAGLEADGFKVRAHVRSRARLGETLSAIVRRPSILRGLAARSSKELVGSVLWVDLRPIVEAELASGDYDLVVIESSFAAFWRGELQTELPVVLVTHEVESAQLLAKAARIGGFGGFIRYVDASRVRRYEQRWSPRFDAIVVMSRDEERMLETIVGAAKLPRIFIVGNGTDINALADLAPDPDEQRVLFTGTMAYPPNAVGAQWLAREVWPRVQAEAPAATLEIVGARPSKATSALGGLPGVSVHADVPEMAPWFDRSSICVLPMLEGGGTRLKLADAFAANRAVVSTTNGATGVDCRSGHDLLIADSADDFARAILRLLSDAEMRARIARHGRDVAERLSDWGKLGEDLNDALTAVASSAAGNLYPLRISSTAQ